MTVRATVVRVSRRQTLVGLGLGLSGLMLTSCRSKSTPRDTLPRGTPSRAMTPEVFAPDSSAHELNPFVVIAEDGGIHLVVARTEMGQGIRTALAMLLAEELRVEWGSIRVHQADGDPRYGSQHTDGSISIYEDFPRLREIAATARVMLTSAAAKAWEVSSSSCEVASGTVTHPPTGRSARYGELAAAAAKLEPPAQPELRTPEQWQLIGSSPRSVDVEDIVRGRCEFAIDTRRPDMRIAVIARAPIPGSTLTKVDDAAARAVPGVLDIVRLPAAGPPANLSEAVAVVAASTSAAIEGRAALVVEWSPPEGGTRTRAELDAELKAALDQPGKVYRSSGGVGKRLADTPADQRLEVEYHAPARPHAPMEPPACTVRFDGRECEVWAPSQSPQGARKAVAETLGLEVEAVRLHVCRAGGSFGRKGQRDYVVEAASLAKLRPGAPIKVVWTREDEIRQGYYRPACTQRIRARVEADGRVSAWEHKSAFATIGRTFRADARTPAAWEAMMGPVSLPYAIEAVHTEFPPVDTTLRTGWVRAVHHVAHAWAINDFVDRLAERLGRDPIAMHEALLGSEDTRHIEVAGSRRSIDIDLRRLRACMRKVASMADYDQTGKRHLGFAVHHSFRSYVAMIVEVEAAADRPTVAGHRVARVFAAVDCGHVIHAGHAAAQIEGAVAFGLSAALWGGITPGPRGVQEGNFDDFPVLRLPDCPPVTVEFIDSGHASTGLGEPGMPPVAPALGNALARATGRRCSRLPMVEFYASATRAPGSK